MKHTRSVAMALTLAAMTSLSTAAVVAQQEAEQAPAPAPPQPFAGIFAGTVSFEVLEEPTEECPLGVRTVTDATGSSTLGEVTLHAEHCPTVGLPTVPVGSQVITTAEGDELVGSYFVDCDPVMPSAEAGEPVTCLGRFAVTGGSGRFAEAAGTAHETAFVWFPGSMEAQAWPWLAKLEGSIVY